MQREEIVALLRSRPSLASRDVGAAIEQLLTNPAVRISSSHGLARDSLLDVHRGRTEFAARMGRALRPHGAADLVATLGSAPPKSIWSIVSIETDDASGAIFYSDDAKPIGLLYWRRADD